LSPAAPLSTNASRPKGLGFALKLVWVNLSILVFGVIFLELGAYMYYMARSAVSLPSDEAAAWVDTIPADAYPDRTWLTTGFHETSGPGGQWAPYVAWRGKPFSGRYVNVDVNGLRHTWNMQATQPLEIYVFGGSTLWGQGARDDYTIPSALSKMLAEVFPSRVRVTNFGQLGYVNTQEMIALFRELQHGSRPDIAIFYDGYNDTFAAFQNRVAGVPQSEQNRIKEFNILNRSRSRDLYWEVLKRSNLYNLMEGVHTKLFGTKPLPPLSPEMQNQLAADVLQNYSMNKTIIESVAQTTGFISCFYWQPTPYTRPNRNRFEESWLRDAAQELFFEEVYAAVRRSSLETNASFHDISDVFQGHEGTLYIDEAHTTERGNEIIARRIFQDVAPLVAREIARRQSKTGGLIQPEYQRERPTEPSRTLAPDHNEQTAIPAAG
jgi:lysophospholipase L1-like esterase